VTYFLYNFEKKIYKYTKNLHRPRGQDLYFKHYHQVFPLRTSLLVIDFAKNYTFVSHKETQREYYHFDQVSIIFHVINRHVQLNVDDIEKINNDCK
jgi:hypothetical protein